MSIRKIQFRHLSAVKWIIVLVVLLYVVELILLRLGVSEFGLLLLSPQDVLKRGFVFQMFTYMWFHSADNPFHMAMNMLFLWFFGREMEQVWGKSRFIKNYIWFGFAGALLVVFCGMLGGLVGFEGFYRSMHIGASGATMGVTIAWGLLFRNQVRHFMFFGPIKCGTFVLILIGFEVLVALSQSPVSSAAHFGGMLGGFIQYKFAEKKWSIRRFWIKKKARTIEHELRLIQGEGRPRKGTSTKSDPSKWN